MSSRRPGNRPIDRRRRVGRNRPDRERWSARGGLHDRDREREREAPVELAGRIPSRLVMQLSDPSGYTSFGFQPIDLPRFVAGRALDPVDRVELQIAQPPAALVDAVTTLAAEQAGVRPPLSLEERSP